jgi:hypothetical protein
MAWATVAAIEARRIVPAAVAAALAALSLSINVENLPYVVVEIAAFALAFVAQGQTFRAALFGFGAALAGAALAVFAATIGPARWFVGVCDAFSTAHLFAIVLGAAAFCALAAAAPRLGSVALRLAGCAVAGVLVLGAMALVYPSCLHDPQAAVDPLLRKLWLDNVQEARPLVSLVAAQPVKFFTFALAALLGFAAVLVAAWRESGETRTRWIVLGGFVAVGLLTSLWQVRALSSASAVAVFGGAWLVARATEWAVKRADPLAKIVPFALALPFCSVFWLLVTPAEAKSDVAEGRLRCRAPAEVATLAALPKSLLLAPIDMGSDILVQTRHSVLAAPYHRNNHGNLALVNSMMAEPAAAERLVRGSGADYVVFCPAMPELEIYAAASPNGLAAALLAGRAPDWLTPESIEGSPYKIYRVR